MSQDIWSEVKAERARAHAKHGEKSMEAAPWTAERRLRILLEELGEVAKEFNDADLDNREPDADAVRKELIQVAAMAGAWADVVPVDYRAPIPEMPWCFIHAPHPPHGFATAGNKWQCFGVDA
jgi:NTP pyrophosphatase (non-canonical NTP hydrolase)